MRELTGFLNRPRSLRWRLGLSVGVALAVLVLRFILISGFHIPAPVVLQLPAVLVAGLLAGWPFGLLALGILLAGNLLLVPPFVWQEPTSHLSTLLSFGAFTLNGLVVLAICGALRGAVGKLRTTRDALQSSVGLQQSALATLEALLAHAPLGFGFFDAAGRVVQVNATFCAMAQADASTVSGRDLDALLPTAVPRLVPILQEVFETGGVRADLEVVSDLPDGPRVWLASLFPVRAADGAVSAVGMTLVDISARKKTEQALEESARRFAHLAEALPQMVWTADSAGKSDYFNSRWNEFTGAAGETFDWEAFLHPDERDETLSHWRVALGSGKDFSRETRMRASGGDYQWFLCRAVPVRDSTGQVERWFGSCTDISEIVTARETLARSREDLEAMIAQRTAELAQANAQLSAEIAERVKTEEQLRQAQKMEAVGQLTGGVAHDFNNLLTVIIGNLEAAERRIPEHQTDIATFLDYARQGALRGATLTQRLLAFSRRQPLDPRPTDINRLVGGMSELLRGTLGERVRVETVLAGGLWWTEVDTNQLESAILNLAVNARDAMPGGGKLTIETANAHLDEAYAAANDEISAGQYVMIGVSDNGEGMSGDTLAHAFEPFFTTKGPGEGTGLGLSQVYGFVKQSGGHVKIYSEPGEGTSLKIYLPRLPPTQETPPEPQPAPTRAPRRAGLSVLVVEDDHDVRRYATDVLLGLGYEVMEAGSGEDALDILTGPRRVDLLFTDMILGSEITGRQVADRARLVRPSLRVLFTTAFARNAVLHNGRLERGEALLTKPYSHADLAGKVRDVLEQPEPRGTALLVEDEPFVAMVAQQILEDEGFQVTLATTGGRALAIMEQDGAGLSLAVVDVGLPDMRGDDLVTRLLAVRADLPVLVASGYGTGELGSLFAHHARLALLPKPYDAAALRRALRDLGFTHTDAVD